MYVQLKTQNTAVWRAELGRVRQKLLSRHAVLSVKAPLHAPPTPFPIYHSLGEKKSTATRSVVHQIDFCSSVSDKNR